MTLFACATCIAAYGQGALVLAGSAIQERAASPLGTNEQPRVELGPARVALELTPGSTRAIDIVVANRTSSAVSLTFDTIDLVAGTDGAFAAPAPADVQRSSRAWLVVPVTKRTLLPRRELRFRVILRVPNNARPGAHAVGLIARQRFATLGATSSNGIGSRVLLDANLVSQVVVAVPGDARSGIDIVRTNAPRVVWSGDASPQFVAIAENTGDTLLKLEGATQLSSFGAFAKRSLKSTEQSTLPGGQRRLVMPWTDRPWIGWFRPRLVVVGGEGSGIREELELPAVFVIPPWWVLAALVVAISWPVASSRRRRRRMQRRRQNQPPTRPR